MTLSISSIALCAFILALFTYLVWLRPDSYVRYWVWVWVGLGLAQAWREEFPAANARAPVASLLELAAMALLFRGVLQFASGGDRVPGRGWRWWWWAPVAAGILRLVPRPAALGDDSQLVFSIAAAGAVLWLGRRSPALRWLGGLTLAWGLGLAWLPADSPVRGLALPAALALGMMVVVAERERELAERLLREVAMPELEGSRWPEPQHDEAERALRGLVDRMANILHAGHVLLWVAAPGGGEPLLLSRGFSLEFQHHVRDRGAALAALLPRFSGLVVARQARGAGALASPELAALRERMAAEGAHGYVCALLPGQEHSPGVLLAARTQLRGFLSSEIRLLLALAGQTAVALENMRLYRQSVRRGREFEALTHIGTALSSSLDGDSLLRVIHAELQKLMDVRHFYVAFHDDDMDDIRFALEVEDGRALPRRRRARCNALTEAVIASGRPLRINGDVAEYSRRHGLEVSGRVAKNWLGVPIVLQGRTQGVIAVQSYDREDAYDDAHQHVLEILAGQAAVALDNARLFSEVQRDARHMAFLAHIARQTISSLRPREVLTIAVEKVAQVFHYDHIAVGLLDADGRHLEFQAQARGSEGVEPGPAPPTVTPLEAGIVGWVAQTGDLQHVYDLATGSPAAPRHRCSRSVLALPINYAGATFGVLNLESHQPNAFEPHEVLVMQTLADQLAVALRHALLFEEVQQQAVTDSLTGLKTRRFFLDRLLSACAPEQPCGPHFCIVMFDLDNFKRVNDTNGHLKGDEVLKTVGRVLEMLSRPASINARYGGDEFTSMLPNCNLHEARLASQRLVEAIRQDPLLAGLGVSASFGIAAFPTDGRTPDDLLAAADIAMYRDKLHDSGRAGAFGA